MYIYEHTQTQGIKDGMQVSPLATRWMVGPFTNIKNNGAGPGWGFVGRVEGDVFC